MESSLTRLNDDQITAILERCFGFSAHALGVKPLKGGTFNETYLIDLSERERVVLKIAPPQAPDTYWDDVALMRREHTVLPFFACIAPLTPKTIFADFTHQVVERDYILQTFLDGEQWSDTEDELTQAENVDLWGQCGEIVKQIHETTGEQFGYPYPGRSFSNWHEVVLDRFSRIARSLKDFQIEISYFSTISNMVSSARSAFDDIHTPRLLHGDLWTFNLLITHKNGRPLITGVLDTERAWWGDPLVDWIMFLLSIRSEESQWQPRLAAFNHGYGALGKSATARFRQEVYKAMHIGASAVWAAHHGNREDVARARQDLSRIAPLLPKLLD
ncbi:MAG TPA: aminoglycoside phosphotransferase family protein [Anaerolineales bacterium]|nr:aminoglycoside phosphotransferase family protein [Anaerolineales bacterium]